MQTLVADLQHQLQCCQLLCALYAVFTALSPDMPTTPVCAVPAVDAIFQALCEGALANPDPDAEEDEGDFFYDEVTIGRCPSDDHAYRTTIILACTHVLHTRIKRLPTAERVCAAGRGGQRRSGEWR